METLPRSPAFLLLLAAVILAEFAWRRRKGGPGYDLAAAAASFVVAAGNLLLKPLSAGLTGAVFLAVYEVAPYKLPLGDWRVWVVAFVLVEFAYYWFHRLSHEVRWLWASHAVHHSASEMTLPAAIRLGWTSGLSGGWLLFLPLLLAGFPPLMVGGLLAANLSFQFFLHTEAIGKLGPLEWVFNTPSHHRVHHACNERYIDRNYGGVLIVFDRLFGTFVEESADEKPRFGLAHPMTSKNPVRIALHEWARMFADMRRAPSLKAAGAALFGPPRA